MRGSNGTVLTIETPLAPTLTLPSLRVGDTLDNLSIGTSQGHDLSITGLPNGLNNIEPFLQGNSRALRMVPIRS